MAFKNASLVFQGGTAEARALFGKRARVRLAVEMAQFDAINPRKVQPRLRLAPGTEGFVARVPDDAMDMINLVFPASGACPTSLDALMRGKFNVFRVNWATFRANFEIDI
jgi:hypothetical protein